MAHKDIKIQFELAGHKLEAVGFLEDGEHQVNYSVMIARTNQQGKILSEKKLWKEIVSHSDALPVELKQYECLITKLNPEKTDDIIVLCLDPLDSKWHEDTIYTNDMMSRKMLVLRTR